MLSSDWERSPNCPPPCGAVPPLCRSMPGNAQRPFRRWEEFLNRPCSPMRSGLCLSMNGRTSSKSQASRVRCTREVDLKLDHELPHAMWGFMTSRIVHKTAWLSSRSGQARPFL